MGVGVSPTPRPPLPPGKTRYPLYRRLGVTQGRFGQVRKISPPRGFDPRTVQPVASRYTDWATRPTGQQSTFHNLSIGNETTEEENPLIVLTYLIMEQSPWEANRFSASKKIPRILWNPKVYFRIYKCPPPVPILSQMEPVHARTSYFSKVKWPGWSGAEVTEKVKLYLNTPSVSLWHVIGWSYVIYRVSQEECAILREGVP